MGADMQCATVEEIRVDDMENFTTAGDAVGLTAPTN
jgi:hypothetical protein